MGYTTSAVHGIQVPDSAQANNVPQDLGLVVSALEAGSIVRRLTGAQITALTVAQKPAGLLVYNTTAGRLEISNGTTFSGIAAGTPPYAVGERQTSVQTIAGLGTAATVTTPHGKIDPFNILAVSGVATIPSAGVWLVTGSVSYDGDGVGTLMVRQNSTDLSGVNNHYSSAPGGLYGSISISQIVVCAASDTLQLRVQNGSAVDFDIRRAYFTVVKLGV